MRGLPPKNPPVMQAFPCCRLWVPTCVRAAFPHYRSRGQDLFMGPEGAVWAGLCVMRWLWAVSHRIALRLAARRLWAALLRSPTSSPSGSCRSTRRAEAAGEEELHWLPYCF